MKRSYVFIAVLLVVGLAGFGLQQASMFPGKQIPAPEIPPVENPVIGQTRPAFSLQDQTGKLRNINEWDGQVLLVNFWATWCPPCRKEIPGFIALQAQYKKSGLQVIGVAVDQAKHVIEYSERIGMNYPAMAGEIAAAEIARRYGNGSGALPFTAFVGRDGKIARVKTGEISQQEAEKIIQSLL